MLFDSSVGIGMAFPQFMILVSVNEWNLQDNCIVYPSAHTLVCSPAVLIFLVFLNLQTKHFDHSKVALICGIEAVQEAFGLELEKLCVLCKCE